MKQIIIKVEYCSLLCHSTWSHLVTTSFGTWSYVVLWHKIDRHSALSIAKIWRDNSIMRQLKRTWTHAIDIWGWKCDVLWYHGALYTGAIVIPLGSKYHHDTHIITLGWSEDMASIFKENSSKEVSKITLWYSVSDASLSPCVATWKGMANWPSMAERVHCLIQDLHQDNFLSKIVVCFWRVETLSTLSVWAPKRFVVVYESKQLTRLL